MMRVSLVIAMNFDIMSDVIVKIETSLGVDGQRLASSHDAPLVNLEVHGRSLSPGVVHILLQTIAIVVFEEFCAFISAGMLLLFGCFFRGEGRQFQSDAICSLIFFIFIAIVLIVLVLDCDCFLYANPVVIVLGILYFSTSDSTLARITIHFGKIAGLVGQALLFAQLGGMPHIVVIFFVPRRIDRLGLMAMRVLMGVVGLVKKAFFEH